MSIGQVEKLSISNPSHFLIMCKNYSQLQVLCENLTLPQRRNK